MSSSTSISTAPEPGVSTRRLVMAFVAGFISVLVFHQLMLGLLHLLGITPGMPYRLTPVPPFGVPVVISSAFWGGVWGILFALVERTFPRRGAGYWVAALLFGAIPVSLVFWIIVAPLKGLPMGLGWKPAGIATGLLVNGAWGVGTAILLRVLSPSPRRRA